MAFDGAEAELTGAEGQGLRAVLTMMKHAGADVALQGVAYVARAHDVASTYVNERTQGRKTDGSPAVLAGHADVRRMVDEIDALALGVRAAHLLEQENPTPLAHDPMQLTTAVLLRGLWARISTAADNHPDSGRIRRVAARVSRRAPALAPGLCRGACRLNSRPDLR